MDFDEALERVAEVDAEEQIGRAERLIELTRMLGSASAGFSGQAAEWLFEDVKATWLYGYFTSTVLTSRAFCMLQLGGLIRMLPDDPNLSESADSLEQLAEICERRATIDLDLRARLIGLEDSAAGYFSVGLHEYTGHLERRIVEADRFSDEPQLLADARSALRCSLDLIYRG